MMLFIIKFHHCQNLLYFTHFFHVNVLQKYSLSDGLEKSHSKVFRKIHSKTIVAEPIFPVKL